MANKRPVYTCECGDHCWTETTRGFVTLVSPQNVDLLEAQTWTTILNGKPRNHYAISRRNGRTTLLHRAVNPNWPMIDHINGNGLDNRQSNLRPCEPSQNLIHIRRKLSKGYRGVRKTNGRYWARFKFRGEFHYVGCFTTAEEAARAYDVKVVEIAGEFAVTNKMLGLID